MANNKAYIKIDNNKNINLVIDSLNQSFESIDYEIHNNIIKLYCKHDAFLLRLTNIHKLLIQDFNMKNSILVVPFFNEIFEKYINLLGVEILTSYQLFIRLINDDNVKGDLKLLQSKFSKQDIDTIKAFIDCNCNICVCANELYLHRNSLNYRINNFINNTSIDIRDFHSLMFLQLMFSINK